MKAALFALAVIFQFASAQAATHEIKMLNSGKDGAMVFEPSFLQAKKGDTVKFVPADPGHDVASVAVPKGAKAFAGELNKPLTVKLDNEGVYLYECRTHIAMAMIGVVQVGKPTNLDDAKKAATELGSKIVMNKERAAKYLAQAK